MLKVQLSAAWYHVAQGERLEGLKPLLRHTRPDLVLTAMTLPDGTAMDVKNLLQQDEALADVPVLAIAPRNDKAARLRALAAGVDDVLVKPYNDTLLLARIRNFLRTRSGSEALPLQGGSQPLGFAEGSTPAPALAPPAMIALLTHGIETGTSWRTALQPRTRHRVIDRRFNDMQAVLSNPAPDAVVVELRPSGTELDLIADLRARNTTRHAVLIALLDHETTHLATAAFDLGADAVMMGAFCPKELALRLENQIARKVRHDRMRASVRNGLLAAVTDSLTGLHNRHYALPALQQIVRTAQDSGTSFALMLGDLDHFKRVNDLYGHVAGDSVLIETARRLQAALRPQDLLARIGGEEFLIALPRTDRGRALSVADRLCNEISSHGFPLPGQDRTVAVTMSIGLKICDNCTPPRRSRGAEIQTLIEQADKALYSAKAAGRNRVELLPSAA
ncbi:hypothetical protein AVO45_09585 [Ruegeria marisrubri]|uniref:diguanylate cyclase n=2 Tax=Ruegeria marisrubri TaxID=1685379 RepID=A0A0X3TMY4_9RHOB|nr:hypothetical protein AVO45_09585 [Ruegeria marisrubri]